MTWTLTLTWMPWTETLQICHLSHYRLLVNEMAPAKSVIHLYSSSKMPCPAKSAHSMTQPDQMHGCHGESELHRTASCPDTHFNEQQITDYLCSRESHL